MRWPSARGATGKAQSGTFVMRRKYVKQYDDTMSEDQQIQRLNREIDDLFDGIVYRVYRFDGEDRTMWKGRRAAVRRREGAMEDITSGMAIAPEVVIYTHGAALPSDPGGYGCIAWIAYKDPETIVPLAQFGAVTGRGRDSVWSGYEAMIHALRWAWTNGLRRVLIRTSSQEALLQIQGIWSTNHAELVAQRTTISLARTALQALAIEHYPARDMPVVVTLVKEAYEQSMRVMEATK